LAGVDPILLQERHDLALDEIAILGGMADEDACHDPIGGF
jgi:hypothetical protein